MTKQKPEPKEVIKGMTTSLEIYEEKYYKALDAYGMCLEQIKIKNYDTELGNKIWRLKSEQTRIRGLHTKLENLKNEKIAKKESIRIMKSDKPE